MLIEVGELLVLTKVHLVCTLTEPSLFCPQLSMLLFFVFLIRESRPSRNKHNNKNFKNRHYNNRFLSNDYSKKKLNLLYHYQYQLYRDRYRQETK